MKTIIVSCFIYLGLVFAPSSHAVSITGSAGPLTPGSTVFATFDAPTNPLIATISGGCVSCSGTNPGSGDFLSMSGNTATISFTGLADYFGMLWGSPDSYNIVQFFNGATVVGGPFNNAVFAGPYTNFTATSSSEFFDRIELSSSSCCFEVDNLSARLTVAAVPEPSTYALMLAGLGLVGFVAKRRRKAQVVAL